MNKKGKIILVSGELESGKTRFCVKSATILKERGWETAGLLAPAVFKGGRKVAIDALDLRNGTRRRLAQLKETDNSGGGIQTKRWRFFPETLDWGNKVLEAATPCDLLVVDELGPLEFERNQGLLAGFGAVGSGMYRLSLVVVRPALIERALDSWPGAVKVDINEATDPSSSLNEWIDQN